MKKFGGRPEDYLSVHDFLDSSKEGYCDVRHRAILHNSFGCYLAEKVFGTNITNSDGKLISVRDIAENHIAEDLGFIPTLQDWLKEIPVKPWMEGKAKGNRKILMEFNNAD